MKIILVVVFISYSQYTNTMGTTTWKKNMHTEAKCAAMVKKIHKARPKQQVWCEAPFGKGKRG
jgi:hypothetical protein